MGSIPQGFSSQQGIDGLNACVQSADVLIIVPAYNEEANIEKIVRKLERLPYDYVVINDLLQIIRQDLVTFAHCGVAGRRSGI